MSEALYPRVPWSDIGIDCSPLMSEHVWDVHVPPGSTLDLLHASQRLSAGKMAVKQRPEIMIQITIWSHKDVCCSLQCLSAAPQPRVHVLDGLQEYAEGFIGQPGPRPACNSSPIPEHLALLRMM